MGQDPSISIAIPVYNQASTIQATIESALKAMKGLPGTEIVVSENHSNDGTAELIANYCDRLKIVQPPVHLGISANWNFAVGECSSEWVGMLSGDDLIYPSYVPSLRMAIQRCPTAVFAMGGWNVKNAKSGKKTKRRILSLPSVCKRGRATPRLVNGPKASFASFCFLRSAFSAVGGFSESYNLIQDWILQFDLSLVGDFVKTNRIIAEYVVGQERADLEASRVPLYCKDLVSFCTSKVWEATEAGVQHSALIEACEAHMITAEALLSRHPEWKLQGDEILKPVYERIGKERVSLRLNRSQGQLAQNLQQFIRRFSESVIPS